MPSKRKWDVEDFDHNKSDSNDGDFDPGETRARKSSAKVGPSKRSRTSGSRKRGGRYSGSDIDNDDGSSSSQDELSFDDAPADDDHDDKIFSSSGRRVRKTVTQHKNYKESSENDDGDEDYGNDQPVVRHSGDSHPKAGKSPKGRIVKLRVPKQRANPPLTTRRTTRAQTEEMDISFVELSNSGNHAKPLGVSRSKSPEKVGRTRASRAMKGPMKVFEPTIDTLIETVPLMTPESDADRESTVVTPPQALHENSGSNDGEFVQDSADETMNDVAVPTDIEKAVSKAASVQGETALEVEQNPIEEDDEDVTTTRRTRKKGLNTATEQQDDTVDVPKRASNRRLTRQNKSKKPAREASSDFEPADGSSDAEGSDWDKVPEENHGVDKDADSPITRGRTAKRNKRRPSATSGQQSADELELDQDELAEELHELTQDSRRRRTHRSPPIIYQEPKRRRAAAKPVSYYMPPLTSMNIEEEEADDPAPTPARNRRGGRGGAGGMWQSLLNTTYGPFGGAGAGALLGGPWGRGATGGVDSDSSDDGLMHRPAHDGMTPTTGAPTGLIPGIAQPINLDGIPGVGAAPNVGKVKNHKAQVDADPLGVDLNVDFTKVGGLQGHIDQLKEMVQLPLLYPELFLRFHVTPPRGVLFHGPPGTGKTLLARALANSVGTNGRKITFYMRKGADALSKWVGEAERQLRLLFEEAKRTQPSIIFFDEIDGLAPVRSSKQEQIHASIVSTLLALMDGMDGRGQVIVIGATNRPDNIDPALRRPGRFDREFYFPLPDVEGRRSIIDINTQDWGLSDDLKSMLAQKTKGCGGADLRALCTEAAINSIQRTYPQIYSSKEKLVTDPQMLSVRATDFLVALKKLVPSSERTASSGVSPLPSAIEPLLRAQFRKIRQSLDALMPRPKNLTALEEAKFEQFDDPDDGFGRETLRQEFVRSRIFRPRLLIHGSSGMGQSYLASAILHYLEGVHVQNFDLANLLADGRPIEQIMVGFFTDIKRHKPSVIFIPNIDTWHETLQDSLGLRTFCTMLRSLASTDPVLLLATAECPFEQLHDGIRLALFAYSEKNQIYIERPDQANRREFLTPIISHLRKQPSEFPDPVHRKLRVLKELELAPPPPVQPPSRQDIKAILKRDRQLLNVLKTHLQPLMDQINRRYKRLRQPAIPPSQLEYLFSEADPNYVRPDMADVRPRPYEIVKDKNQIDVLRDKRTGKCYYNLDSTIIEERLSNGYYARPKDFEFDIRTLAKDARNTDDKDRQLKANELLANMEVDISVIEAGTSTIDWEQLYQRQLARSKIAAQKRAPHRPDEQLDSALVESDRMGDEEEAIGLRTEGDLVPGFRSTARFLPNDLLPTDGLRGQARKDANQGEIIVELQDDCRIREPRADRLDEVDGAVMDEDVRMQLVGVDADLPTVSIAESQMKPPPTWTAVKAARRGTNQRNGNEIGPGHGTVAEPGSRRALGMGQISQRSAVTSLPAGMSPSAVLNDASTTKSPSVMRSWSNLSSTQATNGLHGTQPVYTDMPDTLEDPAEEIWPPSQLQLMARTSTLQSAFGSGSYTSPTTSSGPQESVALIRMSASGSDASARGGGPATLGSGLRLGGHPLSQSVLTGSGRSSGISPSSSQQFMAVDEHSAREFLDQITDKTSGCTIEQLEQVNRELMNELWNQRHQWNRNLVLNELQTVFNNTIHDIESHQVMLSQSQEV